MNMNQNGIAGLLEAHLARYPASEITDVYKLLHQASFGPGHAIADRKAAREWLEHDLEQAQPEPGEALIESVHPLNAMVRLHLRPYVASGGAVKLLLDAMVRAGREVRGDPQLIAEGWLTFLALCQAGNAYAERFEAREVLLFGRVYGAAQGWPAIHHSPAFHAAYQPSYRVLTLGEAEALCRKLGVMFEMI
jgi:hypothetical protein